MLGVGTWSMARSSVGGDVVGRGHAGSPGSGGASPYLSSIVARRPPTACSSRQNCRDRVRVVDGATRETPTRADYPEPRSIRSLTLPEL